MPEVGEASYPEGTFTAYELAAQRAVVAAIVDLGPADVVALVRDSVVPGAEARDRLELVRQQAVPG